MERMEENQEAQDEAPRPQVVPEGPRVRVEEQVAAHQQVVSDDGLEMNLPPQQPQHQPHHHHSHGLNANPNPNPNLHLPAVPPYLPHHHQAMAMAQYYEARMRDHAAAYASAAAGAAWAAAQIAASPTLPPSLPTPIVYQPPPNFHPPHHAPLPSYPNPYSPPSLSSVSLPPSNQDFANEERPVKRHQRTHPNKVQEKRGRRRQRDYSSSSDTGGRSNQHYKTQRRTHYHKKRREKLNLVGKTGVSALHEWCVFRKKLPPNFILLPSTNDYFCFAAHVDDLEWSRGRGATKGAAKQDAARKALQALVSGVGFDDSGLVIELCNEDAVEDLPHLAQRLAIDATKRRRCEVYPGTSTTTEDDAEDENAYYASRGASVCSALLFAMWQINDNIPEPPSYVFEVAASSLSNTKEGLGNRPSSFACSATLNLRVPTDNANLYVQEDGKEADEADEVTGLNLINEKEAKQSHAGEPQYTVKVLTGVGTGATKREARHVASAQLLSLLFPDCEGMVEVKAAAEAAREKYAASKALKQQTKRFATNAKQQSGDMFAGGEQDWFAKPTDPEMPQSVIDMVRFLKEERSSSPVTAVVRVEEDEVSVESLSLSETTSVSVAPSATEPVLVKVPAAVQVHGKNEARAFSRQQQLEAMLDGALQTLNEFDEEGRSLPHEPNFQDVGRTVLRRAQCRDARFIHKLLWGKGTPAVDGLSPVQSIISPKARAARRFWGPASATVLLCRAIALHDEPPLGCAVLTLGFSLSKGRVLHVAEIGSEPHLPRERFVELLQQFAAHMKCTLDIKAKPVDKGEPLSKEGLSSLMATSQLNSIADSFLKRKDFLREESAPKLQAVKEEEPEVEENVKDVTKPKQPEAVKDKPSKRSRTD